MQRLNIVEPVRELMEWVNPLIIVEKPNGKFRICLGPKHLNLAISCQHRKLPTAEELFSEMHDAKLFTKLDASSGYWQVRVDEESSKLLAFSTLFGIFDLSIYLMRYIVQVKFPNRTSRK